MCIKDFCTLFPDNPKKYLIFGKRINICDLCKEHDEAWSSNYTFINKIVSDYRLGYRVHKRGATFIGIGMWFAVSTIGTFRWLWLKYNYKKD